MKTALLCLSLVLAIGACGEKNGTKNPPPEGDSLIAWKRNAAIGRGINFGNALEAPVEGEWGLTIKESYIQAVADAGFNSVRLPICWSAHTGSNYPYNIDPAFLTQGG